MSKIKWHSAYKILENYTFKITNPENGYTGTGFLVTPKKGNRLLCVATAAHVIEAAQEDRIEVRILHAKSEFEFSLSHEDRIVSIDNERDCAFLIFERPEDLSVPKKPLPLISEKRHLNIGVQVAWMGFPIVAPGYLCFFSGHISCWVKGKKAYYVDGLGIEGVSGGPTFSISKGKIKIIGIASAYRPEDRDTGERLSGLLKVSDIRPIYGVAREFKRYEAMLRKQVHGKPIS